MTWGAIGAAAVGVVGGALASKGKSQGGTQTVSKDPWGDAVPWLTSNLDTGQRLQNYYQDNPFNSVQQASYGNLFAGNDYINQMLPGLLAQFSQGGGFDRNNSRARPGVMQFPAMQMNYQPTAGLLGAGNQTMNTAANPFATAAMQPPPPAPPAAAPEPYNPWAHWDPRTESPA